MQDPKLMKSCIDSDSLEQTKHAMNLFSKGNAGCTGKEIKHLARKMVACYPRGRMGHLMMVGAFKVGSC